MNVKVDQVLDGEYTWHDDLEPYVFEGETFWDAIADDMEYWSIAYDECTGEMYYFEYATGRTQWDPPKQLVYEDSTHVLLWDATEQWFYIYDTNSHTSRWLEHYDGNMPLEYRLSNEDCWSQATTEELDIDANDASERRFYNQNFYEDSHQDDLKTCRKDEYCTCMECYLPGLFNQDNLLELIAK